MGRSCYPSCAGRDPNPASKVAQTVFSSTSRTTYESSKGKISIIFPKVIIPVVGGQSSERKVTESSRPRGRLKSVIVDSPGVPDFEPDVTGCGFFSLHFKFVIEAIGDSAQGQRCG